MSKTLSKYLSKGRTYMLGLTDGSDGCSCKPMDGAEWKSQFMKFDGKKFSRKFVLGKTLGKGSSTAAFIATANVAPSHGSTPTYMVKKVKRRSGNRNHAVMEEVRILRAVKHPNVVHIHQFYQDDKSFFYIVMEHMGGGELFDDIALQKMYSEENARDMCRTLLAAVKHIHDQDIIHRDLKPANLMISSNAERVVKIVEFGQAFSVKEGLLVGKCGTPHFIAPEVLEAKPYSKPVDMWSMGVIIYLMLSGELPFKAIRQATLYNLIRKGKYKFHSRRWLGISDDAKDLVGKLLVVNTHRRMTAGEAVEHPWLQVAGQALATRDLGNNLHELQVYNAKRKMRAAIQSILAAQMLLESTSSCEKEYVLGEELGRGAFATVFRAEARRATKGSQSLAIKRTTKRGLSEEETADLLQEVRILKSMDHPNIVRFFHFYDDDPDYYYMVIELMAGGELFNRIVAKTYYNEEEARDLCRYLLTSIKYCHDCKVVHRDLKPENLLLAFPDDDTSVKLADFGFAASVQDGLLTQGCGTPNYVAPEVLKGIPYGTSVDMWSMGVIIYIILAGYPPFHDENQSRLFRKIKAGTFKFHTEYWENISADAKDLVRNLLVVDPMKRINASEAVSHPWLHANGDSLKTHDLGTNLEQFRVFNAKRKLRAAVKTVLAAQRIMQNPLLDMSKDSDSDSDSD